MPDAPAPVPAPAPATPPGPPAQITIDDFTKVELKVGKVVTCDIHPNADKLFVIQVDLGTEKRQIVSGIRQYYKPEDLVGKNVIVVANLAPRMMRGIESKGMLLAAHGVGDVAVVMPVRDVPAGAKVS